MRALAATAAAALIFVPVAGTGPSAAAEEPLCVAVTVDYRELGGASGGPSHSCAKVPNRSTGYDILVARAKTLGRPLPRSEGGLVCAIDGLPERGCGESTGDGYRYWSYFHRNGDGTWQYSNRGAGDYRVIDNPDSTSDDEPVEGWVWVDGGAEGSVTPARAPYGQICPPTAKASPSRTPTPRAIPTPKASVSSSARPPAASPSSTAGADRSVTPAGPAASGAAASVPTGTSPAGSGTATSAPADSVEGPAVGATASGIQTDAPGPGTIGLEAESEGGFPASTAAGIGVVTALAFAAAYRRRGERSR